jgi:hypothetical protein
VEAFWVDQESYLLRKSEKRVSPEQMAAVRKHGGSGSGRVTSTVDTETYEVERVNKPLNEKLFADPTSQDKKE